MLKALKLKVIAGYGKTGRLIIHFGSSECDTAMQEEWKSHNLCGRLN